jgi:transposase
LRSRDREDLEALAERLRILSPALIVLEATGGFEAVVTATLAGAGLPLAVVNPAQVRAFGRATGRLDAGLIAHFAEAIRPEPRPVASEQAQALAELVTRRRQVIEMIGRESNRRRRARSPKLLRGIECTLAALQAARSRRVRAAPRPRDPAQGPHCRNAQVPHHPQRHHP